MKEMRKVSSNVKCEVMERYGYIKADCGHHAFKKKKKHHIVQDIATGSLIFITVCCFSCNSHADITFTAFACFVKSNLLLNNLGVKAFEYSVTHQE
jgi:hypothetical protein